MSEQNTVNDPNEVPKEVPKNVPELDEKTTKTLERFFVVGDFADKIGQTFKVAIDLDENGEIEEDEIVELKLVRCKEKPVQEFPGRKRDPFSLYFHGPAEFELPQQLVPLRHDDLGELMIFLVALGPITEPDGKGGEKATAIVYQAVFN